MNEKLWKNEAIFLFLLLYFTSFFCVFTHFLKIKNCNLDRGKKQTYAAAVQLSSKKRNIR